MRGIIKKKKKTLFFKKLFHLTIKSTEFPSKNGITLTKNVLLSAFLSSICLLSSSNAFPFFVGQFQTQQHATTFSSSALPTGERA